MDKNALVSWLTIPESWLLEEQLLGITDLPLNLEGNNQHPFRTTLNVVRADARAHARSLPHLPNPGVGGASID